MRFKYQITLKEAFSYWYSSNWGSFDSLSNYAFSKTILSTFVSFLTTELGSYATELNFIEELTPNVFTLSPYAEAVIEYVARREGRNVILEVYDLNHVDDELLDWLDRFVNVLSMTFDKYSLLLNLYTTKKADLIKSIQDIEKTEASSSSSSNSRFNDTPQNYQGQQSYNDDDYATNQGYSSSEGGSEITITRDKNKDYLVNVIAELDKNFLNVLLRWSNEFRMLFLSDSKEAPICEE